MIFRAFLFILALVAVYLIYDSARLLWLKHAVNNADPAYVMGQDDAELKIVEFLDYSCPKCQKTHPVLMTVIDSEPSVQYIPRPFSTTENGRLAARFAYAAGRQGRFFEVHDKLITDYHAMDMAYVDKLIADMYLNEEQLKKDINDPEIIELVEKNQKYNAALGSYTIPTFFINNSILWIIDRQLPSINDFQNVIRQTKAYTRK